VGEGNETKGREGDSHFRTAMDNATAEALKPMKATSDGVFQGENPLHSALPLAILQICIVVVLTRVLAFILRPLRQPRVIAEIIVSASLG
jgi:hypothetical protein